VQHRAVEDRQIADLGDGFDEPLVSLDSEAVDLLEHTLVVGRKTNCLNVVSTGSTD
jgi:hypothetical protein